MFQDNEPGDQRPGPREKLNPLQALSKGKLPLPMLGGIAVTLVIGLILIVAALSGGNGGEGEAIEPGDLAGLRTEVPVPEATIDLNREVTAAPAHLESVGPDDRMVISRFGVSAPLSHRKVPADGRMPDPDGPDDVAYYDFSNFENLGGAPGRGGNSVFAGHVDYGRGPCDFGRTPPPCRAVLWHLSDLRLGDEIEIHLNGNVYRYHVASNEAIRADLRDGTWDRVVSSTAEETITIISCGGDFNRVTRDYSHRIVVTAVRVAS